MDFETIRQFLKTFLISCISGSDTFAHRSDWEENCVADARQVRVLGVCWGAGKIPKRLEVLVPRVKPTGLDGWEKIKVAPHYLVLVQSQHQAYTVAQQNYSSAI